MKAVVFTLIGILLILVTSCMKDADCPLCPTAPVSDYNVYMADQNSNKIYVYNTRAMDIVDTITLPSAEVPIDIDVSFDGLQLLVTSASGFTVYNLANMAIVTTRPYAGDIEVSWSGRYVAVVDDDSLVILDGTSYAPVLSDTLFCMNPRFSLDDSQLYCVRDSQYIRAYDIAADSVVLDIDDAWIDNGPFYWVVLISIAPTYDKNRLILYFYYTNGSNNQSRVLSRYDIDTDSSKIINAGSDIQPAIDIKSYPSGEILYYATKDSIWFVPDWQVRYLSAKSGMNVAAVPCGYAANDSTGPHGFVPNDAIVTPDGQYTVVTSAFNPPAFGLIDNSDFTFIDVKILTGYSITFGAIACQNKVR